MKINRKVACSIIPACKAYIQTGGELGSTSKDNS